MKLHIGAGKNILKGYINIDTHLNNGADKVHFLPKPLPYKDNSIDEVLTFHVLEDFTADIQRKIILDFLRVLKPKGILHLKMPHVSNKCFVGSIYHQKPIVSGTFNALVKGFEEDNYSEPNKYSKYLLKRINFHRKPRGLWLLYGWWNEPLANLLRPIYEFSIWSNIFPAHEVEIKIQK